jgi:hypothetical protein
MLTATARAGDGGGTMACIIALFGLIGPRLLIAFWWLTDPARWTTVFGSSPLVPALGFLFLPWTTLFYVLFWTTGGLSLLGWVFVVLGLLADLGTYGGGFFGNKERVSSYYK